jgi:lipid-binding SYLF domain-containing protein
MAYGIARQGLFGGVRLGGGRITFHTAADNAIYDGHPTLRQVQLQADEAPASMQHYTDVLQQFIVAGHKVTTATERPQPSA